MPPQYPAARLESSRKTNGRPELPDAGTTRGLDCRAAGRDPALLCVPAATYAARPLRCVRSLRKPLWPTQPRRPRRTTSGQPCCRSRAGGADAAATKKECSRWSRSTGQNHRDGRGNRPAWEGRMEASPATARCPCSARRPACNYAGTSAVQAMRTVRPLQPSPKSLEPTRLADVTRIIGEPSRQVRIAATSALHSARTVASPFSRGA